MKFATALRLVALAATAGLGGGFLWGVADHRSDEAVMNFVDQHIVLPETEGDAWLVFSCGSSERLVAYDLLNDEVLKNNEQIRILIHRIVSLGGTFFHIIPPMLLKLSA